MSDVFDSEKRSVVMRKVRSKGNKSTELKLIALFRENGITGWRRNYRVKGHPDFVFLDKRIAVFVDGCFWHGHDCRNTRPENNKEYWQKKRTANMKHEPARLFPASMGRRRHQVQNVRRRYPESRRPGL